MEDIIAKGYLDHCNTPQSGSQNQMDIKWLWFKDQFVKG